VLSTTGPQSPWWLPQLAPCAAISIDGTPPPDTVRPALPAAGGRRCRQLLPRAPGDVAGRPLRDDHQRLALGDGGLCHDTAVAAQVAAQVHLAIHVAAAVSDPLGQGHACHGHGCLRAGSSGGGVAERVPLVPLVPFSPPAFRGPRSTATGPSPVATPGPIPLTMGTMARQSSPVLALLLAVLAGLALSAAGQEPGWYLTQDPLQAAEKAAKQATGGATCAGTAATPAVAEGPFFKARPFWGAVGWEGRGSVMGARAPQMCAHMRPQTRKPSTRTQTLVPVRWTPLP
jgi:hypothetical protein